MEEEVEQVQQSAKTSRVLKVDSKESWDLLISQANSRNIPVFVHFTASWCVPSLAMNPYFEELSMDHEDVLFLLVDVDELKVVAKRENEAESCTLWRAYVRLVGHGSKEEQNIPGYTTHFVILGGMAKRCQYVAHVWTIAHCLSCLPPASICINIFLDIQYCITGVSLLVFTVTNGF